MKYIFTILAIFLLHTSLFSAVIQIDPNDVAGNDNINFFQELQGGGFLQALNGELTINTGDNLDQQVKFAEKFVGQNLVFNGNFDVLQGNPTGPLTLAPGVNGQNLFFAINRFGGAGKAGFNKVAGRGEGSIAILFPTAVFEFAIEINDIQNAAGRVEFNFFDSEGNTIDTVTLTGLNARNTIAFREENSQSIIAGVSIENFDVEGITVENLRFEADNNVPEPGTYLLLAIGGLIAFVRFGRKKQVQEELEA